MALCFVALVSLTFATANAAAQDVAITVDDLPSHSALPPGVSRADVARSFVKTFHEFHLPEVYGFVNAGKLQEHPEELDVLKIWREAGQPLGSHTFTHMSLSDNPAEVFEQNIAQNEPQLQTLMGTKDWHWFRYPFLWEGDTLEKRHAVRDYLKQRGYRIAQVTLDFEDYLWNEPYARCMAKNDQQSIEWLKSSYLATAAEYIQVGQKLSQLVYGREIKHVLLLHIGGFDAVMLPDLLKQMKSAGFRFVTLKEAEKDPAYQSDPDAALKYGGTLLEQMMESKHIQYPQFEEKPYKKLNEICR